jgi:hypothetical protein
MAKDDPTPDPTPLPSGEAPPSPSSSAPPSLDEATISDLIKRQVAALFAAQPKADPLASGPSAGDVQTQIDAAIAKALAERDKEDQVFVLQQAFDELKASLPKPPKGGWGRFLLGPGVPR